jgi:hypothetical protein
MAGNQPCSISGRLFAPEGSAAMVAARLKQQDASASPRDERIGEAQ